MMIDSAKEAYEVLDKAVEGIEDDWDKNQAIDAMNYLRENTVEKTCELEEAIINTKSAIMDLNNELGGLL